MDLSCDSNPLVCDLDTLLTLIEHDFYKHKLTGKPNYDDLERRRQLAFQ